MGKKKTSKAKAPAPEADGETDVPYQLSERCDAWWDGFCDYIEASGSFGAFLSQNVLRRLVVNAPVILGFALLCILLHMIDFLWSGTSKSLGCPDAFHPTRPMAWVQLVTHVFGHSGYQHLKGNMVNLMLVGPSAEHRFGSKNLMMIILSVAISSSAAHILVGSSHSVQLGASGVVFAMILLNSLVSASYGTIPVTFVITAALWITDEVVKVFFSKDGVSHHAHLTGAMVGTMAGYVVHKRRAEERAESIAAQWLSSTRNKKKSASSSSPWWAPQSKAKES